MSEQEVKYGAPREEVSKTAAGRGGDFEPHDHAPPDTAILTQKPKETEKRDEDDRP